MPETILQPVELVLSSGRSLSLRLSQGAWLRFLRATGSDGKRSPSDDPVAAFDAESRILYECAPRDFRQDVTYEDFIDDLDPGVAKDLSLQIVQKFMSAMNRGAPPSEPSPSTGSSGGPSEDTTSA